MLATRIHYTFADLLQQAPDDEQIYDILGGELVVWTSPVEAHAAVVMKLIGMLLDAENAGFGAVRTAPRAVAFDYAERGLQAEDVTRPDVFFVREERRAVMGERCVEAAPALIVEVLSPSTRADDLAGGRKFAIYERYGVPYYWFADVDARTVTQYEWRDGGYGEGMTKRPGDTLNSTLFPGVTRDVAEIFAGLS